MNNVKEDSFKIFSENSISLNVRWIHFSGFSIQPLRISLFVVVEEGTWRVANVHNWWILFQLKIQPYLFPLYADDNLSYSSGFSIQPLRITLCIWRWRGNLRESYLKQRKDIKIIIICTAKAGWGVYFSLNNIFWGFWFFNI